jgi:hypothetical protein
MIAERGQQGIIGVALLLLLTVIAIGTMTSLLGGAVTGGVAQAELRTVGTTLATVTAPTDDPTMQTMLMRTGTLETHPGTLWITGADIAIEQEVGTLRYGTGHHRLSSEYGTQITTVDGEVIAVEGQRIRRVGDRLYLGVPSMGLAGVDTIATNGRAVRVGVRPRVDTQHRRLPRGRYQVRLETDHPSVWVQMFEEVGARVHIPRSTAGTPVVTADFEEPITIELLSQRVQLEVL